MVKNQQNVLLRLRQRRGGAYRADRGKARKWRLARLVIALYPSPPGAGARGCGADDPLEILSMIALT